MKRILKFFVLLLPVIFLHLTGAAQNIERYKLSDADITRIDTNQNAKNFIKKALVLLPKNDNHLSLKLKINSDTIEENFLEDLGGSFPDSLVEISLPIDRSQIQEALTSSKTFRTTCDLTFNNITKEVNIAYMPIASGTEEDGNFNLSVLLEFDSCNFSDCESGTKRRIIIKLDNAVVNRL